jgi:hypothetical protein
MRAHTIRAMTVDEVLTTGSYADLWYLRNIVSIAIRKQKREKRKLAGKRCRFFLVSRRLLGRPSTKTKKKGEWHFGTIVSYDDGGGIGFIVDGDNEIQYKIKEEHIEVMDTETGEYKPLDWYSPYISNEPTQ